MGIYLLVDRKVHALEVLHLALEGCTGYRAEALAVVKARVKSSTGSCSVLESVVPHFILMK